MRVIPVLDILGGQAVHARAGSRDSYAPLSTQLAPGRSGDALAIARAFHDLLGFDELYIADLDAVVGRPPQRSLRRAIATACPGVSSWIDAGIASTAQARELLEDGAARVIIGLETLPIVPDPRAALAQLVASIDAIAPPGVAGRGVAGPAVAASGAQPRRVAFSLDLRAGRPIAADPALAALAPLAIAELAAECGVATIIVLDLARVGTGAGIDHSFIRAIRRALPSVELVAGGGVKDAGDLERLSDSGADGALVASALHDGSLAQRSGFWGRARGTLSSTTSPPDA